MTGRDDNVVRFANFSADLTARKLFCNGERVALENKPFRVLELLLHSAGSYVSRAELLEIVWPGLGLDAQPCLNAAIRKLRRALGDHAARPTLVETVSDRGYRILVVPIFPRCSPRYPSRLFPTLAAKPFQNLNGSDRNHSDARLTKELVAELGKISPRLSVVAPHGNAPGSDSTAPCGRGRSPGDYVLSGSTRGKTNRLGITSRLVRSQDQACLWEESFAGEPRDSFRIRDEVAQNIASAIRHDAPDAAHRHTSLTTSLTTYDKYLRARFYCAQGTEAAYRKAINLFEQVSAEDAGFAPAYAYLAILYAAASQYGVMPPKIIYARVRDLATRALRLNPDLPEAHAALGFESLLYHADFVSAEKSLLCALRINPCSVAAQQGFGFLMSALGRHEAAVSAMQYARSLDPFTAMNGVLVASALCLGGRLSEALAEARQVIDMAPCFPSGHACEGWILSSQGQAEQALHSFRRAVECSPESTLMQAHLAFGLALAHKEQEARAMVQQFLQLRASNAGWVSPYWLALIHSALGKQETALDWLETAAEEGDGWRVFAMIDERTLHLRKKTRFREWAKHLRVGTMQPALPAR